MSSTRFQSAQMRATREEGDLQLSQRYQEYQRELLRSSCLPREGDQEGKGQLARDGRSTDSLAPDDAPCRFPP